MDRTDTCKAALAAAALFCATPAAAQATSADGRGHALILVPLELTKIDDLDFGTIVAGSTPGTVIIPANGSARSTTGGVTPLPSDVGFRARFATAATRGQEVLFLLTPPATLDDGNGNSITVDAMTMDGPNLRYADLTTGIIFVGVGGIISVAADQPDGVYEGTFNLYAEYR
ncbi:DUF4402 domain-containing protein [Sphingomicrobium nitratireducens]|uniref:DUF4402 domain-containing protein n=1 Tax=Sphingomicrobium nitratireducens TaxID=2964666 RepID=UPI002240B516